MQFIIHWVLSKFLYLRIKLFLRGRFEARSLSFGKSHVSHWKVGKIVYFLMSCWLGISLQLALALERQYWLGHTHRNTYHEENSLGVLCHVAFTQTIVRITVNIVKTLWLYLQRTSLERKLPTPMVTA